MPLGLVVPLVPVGRFRRRHLARVTRRLAQLVPGALLRAGQGLGWLAAAVMDHGVHMCFFVSVLFTALSAKRDLLDDAVGAVAAPLQLRDARRRQLVRALRGCIEGVLFVPLQVRA